MAGAESRGEREEGRAGSRQAGRARPPGPRAGLAQGRWEPWRLLPSALLGLLPEGQTKGARAGGWGPGRTAQVQVADAAAAPGGGRGVGKGDRFRTSFAGRGLAYGLDVEEERVVAGTTSKCLAQPGKGCDCHLLRGAAVEGRSGDQAQLRLEEWLLDVRWAHCRLSCAADQRRKVRLLSLCTGWGPGAPPGSCPRNHPPTQRPYGQILELSATPGAEPPALRSNPAPQPVGGERSKRISGLHPGWHSHFGADLD